MKQFYPNLLLLRQQKSLLFLMLFLGLFYGTNAQQYTTRLFGSIEVPSNNSLGTGMASVTIVGTTMRVQTSFSGLSGTTTASHIHAATAASGTGTAGVATTVPNFVGFPLGVKAGTMDETYNMMLASSYNPAYVTANGGTPASAFAALKAAMDAGKSYLNIHSNLFPGGEIRGFLIACPNITVSIANAFALSQGALPNTVYPAYAPAASLMLASTVSGGAGPYSYNWSNGGTSSGITVSPASTIEYSLTVKDQNGCLGGASKTVSVMDIAGGKKGEKIVVCHNGGNALTIASSAVAAHLEHGDMLGSCSEQNQPSALRKTVTAQHADEFSTRVLANPSPNYFDLQINGNTPSRIQVRVFDMLGRIVETKSSVQLNQTLRLGGFYKPGIYIVEIVQGVTKHTLKLVKTK